MVYFVNSGSDANDLAAMLMARAPHRELRSDRSAQMPTTAAARPTMGLTAQHAEVQPPQGASACISDPAGPLPRASSDTTTPGGREARVRAGSYSLRDERQQSGFIRSPFWRGRRGGRCLRLPGACTRRCARPAVCIADEVQTSFRRTGENFWGFQTVRVALASIRTS